MCGIAGIFKTDKTESVSHKLLSDMISGLKHRGPDEESFHVNGRVGLGHCRLSIIDLEHGGQPMFNEDKSISIVFNGEIYNFKQLRNELIKNGHIFRTNSDTEVIIHAYEQFGNSCVEHLRGMFAFAIWDSRKEILYVARDRVGIKPLFYYRDDKKFLFSSEIKSILRDPSIKREMNYEALEDYLSYGYIPAPKTIFIGINKLYPGHFMTVSKEGIKISEYWDLIFGAKNNYSEDYYSDGLLERIKESVNSHMISDVPLGAFLSGGIDSSTIVGLMSKSGNNPIDTVSIGFDEPDFDELRYAGIASRRFNTNSHEKILYGCDSLILDQLISQYDEPFADPAMIPNFYISKLARENLTVCLSGDGGDEVFGGYTRFMHYVNLSQTSVAHAEEEYFKKKSYLNSEMKNHLYSDSLKSLLGEYNSFHIMKKYFNRTHGWDSLSRVQYVELKTYLVDDILVKVDRSSMANSLEVRVPLLDHELLKFAASIPSIYKFKNDQVKYILKKALSGIVPREIINRPKKGLLVPLHKWFRNELKNVFEQKVFKNNSFAGEFFNLKYIHDMWDQHQCGSRDNSKQLWTILILETWADNYIH